MSKHTASVSTRDLNKNLNTIRKTGVPGNIFSPKEDSTAITISTKDFLKLFGEVGESGVAYLKLDRKEIPVMIEEVQWHPVRDEPLHVLFKVVDLKQKTEALIPVEVVGEFEIPEAVLVTVRDEIEVRALPTDLPEKFVVNVETLTEIGQSITLSELDYDRSKVEIIVGEEGEDAPVVLVQEVKEEEEEEEETEEVEIIGEAEEEGVEAPAGEQEKPQAEAESEGEGSE